MANEARNRLRSMGGIMASSPELLQAQQGYQDGGTVSPTVPVVGGLDTTDDARAARSFGRTPYLDGLVDAPNLNPNPVPVGLAPLTPRERESEQFRQGFFDLIQRGGEGVDRALGYPIGGASGLVGGAFDVAGGAASLIGADSTAAALESGSDQLYNQAQALFQDGLFSAGQLTREDLNVEPEEFGPVLEERRRASAQDERAAATRRALDDLSGEAVPDRPQSDESTVDTTDDERAAATRRALEDLETQLDPAPDPADNTPKAKRTLRDRYEKRMELLNDIFGESDEARARDRAMSLAMMGLAIASGQNPNALTNIAQGAAVGLQSVSEQVQARREQLRELKTLALESVLDEQEAGTAAEAEAARMEAEQQNKLELEAAKAVLDAEFGGSKGTYTPERLRQVILNNITSNPINYPSLLVDGNLSPTRVNNFANAVVQSVAPSAAEAPTVEQRIEQLRAADYSDERIAASLRANDVDPADYGL